MPSKTSSIFLGGLAIGVAAIVLGLIPIVGGCLACIAYLGAGMLAVWHYTSMNELTLTGGQGAGMGALAGTVASVVGTIIQQVLSRIGLLPDWQDAMIEGLEQSGMDSGQVDQWIETLTSPLALVGLTVVGILFAAILGAIGGAIGASMFKKGGEITDLEDDEE